MKSLSLLAFVSVALVLSVGCAGKTSDDASSGDEALSASQQSALIGSFSSSTVSTDPLPFHSITLNADHTYTATGGCQGTPTTGPICFAIVLINGKWSIGKSGPQLGAPAGVATLVLVDQLDQTTSYFFKVDDTSLSLRKAFNSPVTVFQRGPAAPSSLGAEGSQCGGFAGLGCADGLICKSTNPKIPDIGGTCQKEQALGAEGSQCGGFAGLGCADGLTCKSSNPSIPDVGGTCVSTAGAPVGATCGGVAHIECAQGLTCNIKGSKAIDAAGTCIANKICTTTFLCAAGTHFDTASCGCVSN